MSLFEHQCKWPDGCARVGKPPTYKFYTGKCPSHGRWFACEDHSGGYLHNHACETHPKGCDGYDHRQCPQCLWETPKYQEQRREAAKHASRERRRERYVAEFRAQGYGEAAAKALMHRRASEEERREDDEEARIRREREAADREAAIHAAIRAGKLLRCPVCGGTAPARDGVILGHETGRGENRSGCGGYGMFGEKLEAPD